MPGLDGEMGIWVEPDEKLAPVKALVQAIAEAVVDS
jgi:hypothetical protein